MSRSANLLRLGRPTWSKFSRHTGQNFTFLSHVEQIAWPLEQQSINLGEIISSKQIGQQTSSDNLPSMPFVAMSSPPWAIHVHRIDFLRSIFRRSGVSLKFCECIYDRKLTICGQKVHLWWLEIDTTIENLKITNYICIV
jgi:hypothetical protein